MSACFRGETLNGSPRQMLRTGKDSMIRNGDEGYSDGTGVTCETWVTWQWLPAVREPRQREALPSKA